MPNFFYTAIDAKGNEKSGKIEAGDAQKAREELQSRGMYPKSISQKQEKKKVATDDVDASHKRTNTLLAGKVKGKELTLFTRQLATLLEAGMPLLRSLDILSQMLRGGVMRNSVLDISDEVQGGASLSNAMSHKPKVFDTLYSSMIKAGEASGQLGRILSRLADLREKTEKLVRKVIGALVYPAAITVIAVLILTGIMLFVIPKFKEMFSQLGVDLPGPTVLLLRITDEMTYLYFGVIPAAVVYLLFFPFVLYTIWRVVRSFPPGKTLTDMAILKLPIFGLIIRKSSLSRCCRTLGELDAAGVPVLESLAIIKDALGNTVIRAAVNDVYVGIREGENMSTTMRRNKQFDLMTVNMVAVGEETGELDKMLIRVADNFDDEVNVLVESMMSLLEPALIVMMGGAVGFIVISLFMPLISIISALS
ncbi:type II secretion system protein F [Planctomycetales bacterium]|nr:type II secretion system protein F [Planctomycetales bacterium]GHS96126.1 type II secretion system protein F [Planctomycetales bacterium]GHT04308.1 type II secretion system protein F [Planctomycetales bacterium]GHV19508.1 type II secretion system protein F [Planctomycetales bacterium]